MKTLSILITSLLITLSGWAQQGTAEYKLTMPQGGQTRAITSLVYFSDGNVRTDVDIPLPGTASPMKQTILMLANSPNTMYMLNRTNKTYTESKSNSTNTNPLGKSTIKVVGKEKIQNLNCTHALITFDKGSPMDIWTTKDIAGYEKLMSFWQANQSLGGGAFYNDLKKNGAEGFFVRMKNGGMTMELVRYDSKPVAASLFEIPKDYKKGAGFDPSAFKNMTSAERQKLLDAYKKQQKP